MAKKFVVLFVVVLIAAPAFADTRNGNANSRSWARYSFTMPADGEFHATVVWNNANVDIWWVLICGTGEGFIAANALGLQDRIAHLVVGNPGGLPCTLFITTLSGSTPFRLHAQHSADQSLKNGTQRLQLIEEPAASAHEAKANELLQFQGRTSAR